MGEDHRDEPLGRFGHNKLAILLLIFLVFAVLGLPLLWLSPAFSKQEKILWTVAVLIYTAVLVAIPLAIFVWAWGRLQG